MTKIARAGVGQPMITVEQYRRRVLEAVNGVGALRIGQEQGASLALLLTDLVMPGGISGQQLT